METMNALNERTENPLIDFGPFNGTEQGFGLAVAVGAVDVDLIHPILKRRVTIGIDLQTERVVSAVPGLALVNVSSQQEFDRLTVAQRLVVYPVRAHDIR